MRALHVGFGLLAAVTLSLSAGAAPVPKQGKTNAEKVVGKWELYSVKDGIKRKAGDVEFTKDGKLLVAFGPNKFEGKYEVDGDKIDYELKMGDDTKKEVLTIEKLTDDEMVTVDPEGIKEEFKRVKEKDKKEEKKDDK